jgi:YfiH family protein
VPSLAQKKKKVVSRQAVNVLRAENLASLPWMAHGFSTRVGGTSRAYGLGDLNLGFTKDDSKAAVTRNRALFLRELAGSDNRVRDDRHNGNRRNGNRESEVRASPWRLVTLRQVHSDIIHCIDSVPDETLVGDGLVTSTPGLFLAIQTADCIPIVLVDSKRHAIGVFHAGWRGTAKRIVEKGVGEMHRWFGSKPRDLKAAIGPGVHGCCYDVGEEVRDKFESQFSYAANLFREFKDSDPVREKYPLLFLTARAPGHGELPPKLFLDLVEANRRQLLAAGVPRKAIEASPLCTSCRTDSLFSYRAEKGKTGRMMSVAGIRE